MYIYGFCCIPPIEPFCAFLRISLKTLTGPTKPTNFDIKSTKTLTGPTKPTNFDIKSTKTLTGPTKPTKYRF